MISTAVIVLTLEESFLSYNRIFTCRMTFLLILKFYFVIYMPKINITESVIIKYYTLSLISIYLF